MMEFKLQLVIDDEERQTQVEDIIQLNKNSEQGYCAGLSLLETKQMLKTLQEKIVLSQAKDYTNRHKACPICRR